ncbi:MAG: alpha/beta fold hydrolase [Sneathiellaceae bacterium]
MSDIVTTDHRVPSTLPGLSLLVRNKRRLDLSDFGPGGTVLCIHGATYPATVTFDYPVEGESWLDLLARQGFDAWCVDLLGYGGSDRPVAMEEDPTLAAPLVDTAQAAGDAAQVVDFILATRRLQRLCLLGYSWGTAIGGTVAGRVPDRIARLVLYGALWLGAGRLVPPDQKLGAYRLVDADAAAARWLQNLSGDQAAAIVAPGFVRAWAEAAIASDPAAAGKTPAQLRAPTGVIKDVRQSQDSGSGLYDPSAIRCPTMIAVGEWDQETTPAQGREVFDRLVNAAERRYVVLGRGTHTMLLEKQRRHLQACVAGFLKEGWEPAA